MPPTTHSHLNGNGSSRSHDDDDDGDDEVLNVVLTGFGVFSTYTDNPSWMSVRALHDTRLDLSVPPPMPSFPSSATVGGSSATTSASTSTPPSSSYAHLRSLQIPVVYSAVLDTVPRIHDTSRTPSSPHAAPFLDPRGDLDGHAGDGHSYPTAYVGARRGRPDLVVHVGVGRPGGLTLERRAHKSGYRLRDSAGAAAPPLLESGIPTRWRNGKREGERESETERFERLRGEAEDGARWEGPGSAGAPCGKGALTHEQTEHAGGFGRGYEQFDEEELSVVDIRELERWLKKQGVESARTSDDAGRFLCDFIYYTSLCEASRRVDDPAASQDVARGSDPIPVLFIHVPPAGSPLSIEQMTDAIRAAVWWISHGIVKGRRARK